MLKIVAVLILLLLPLSARADWVRLNDAELVTLLSGANYNVLSIDGRWMHHHFSQPVSGPGQKATLNSIIAGDGGDFMDRGTYWIENGRVYLQYQYHRDLVARVFAVEREGDKLRFIEVGRIVPGGRFKELNWGASSFQVWRFR